MKNLDNTADPIATFSRAREKMSTELESLLESSIPVIANDIDAAAQKGGLSIHEQRQLYSAAAMLRMEKRSRVVQARAVFNERALRCLELATLNDYGEKRTLSLLEEDELEVQILAADFAGYIRQEQPQVCLGFAKRIEYLTDRIWSNDDLQPIGPRTLGAAAGAALRSLAMAPAAKREIKAIVLDRLKDSLTRLIVETDRDLIAQGILPDWTAELERTPDRPAPVSTEFEAPPVFEQMPIPAVWNTPINQVFPVSSPTASPAATPVPLTVNDPDSTPIIGSEQAAAATPEAVELDRPFPDLPALSEPDEQSAAKAIVPAAQPAFEQSVVSETAAHDFDDYSSASHLQSGDETIVIEAPREANVEHTAAISALAAQVSRTLARSPLSSADSPTRLQVMPILQPVLDIERDAVAFAHSIGAVPYSRESRREFFHNVGERLRAASASAAQVATVEVVGAMFDYVVDDRRLPEPAKPLFWRLQQPAVALSLLDPGYLSNEPRSLRRLVENFGAIATAYADEFVKGGELHRRLETVVRAVEIVASALQVRSTVISQQVDKEYGRAVRNVTRLVDRVVNERSTLESTPARQNRRDYRRRPDKQREIEVSEKLRLMLEERVNKHQIPESAKEFILTVWMRHLRTAVLRDGEESTEFKLALEVVDDLLWSMDTAKPTQSRRALAKRIPTLIRLLTSGLKEIGAREDEHKSFFDELFLVHLRKMRRGGGQGGDDSVVLSDLSPLSSLPTLNEELPSFETIDAPVETKPSTRTKTRTADNKKTMAGTPSEASARGGPAAADRSVSVPSSLRANTRVAPDAERLTPEVPIFVPGAQRDAAGKAVDELSPVAESGDAEKWSSANPRLARATVSKPADSDDFSAGVLNQPSLRPNGAIYDDRAPEQRLLEVLHSLDLSDPPARLDHADIPVERMLASLGRGQWLTLLTRDGGQSLAKIAWVNSRRTVVLLVRHPDRRALSMRMEELRNRAEQGRAFLIAPSAS